MQPVVVKVHGGFFLNDSFVVKIGVQKKKTLRAEEGRTAI